MLLFYPKKALAYDYVPSAILQRIQKPIINPTPTGVTDYRAEILQAYLEDHNSPLAPYAKNFIKEADQNEIDWKLVAAIAGVESSFGRYIPYNSFNGWGYGIYAGNVRRFISWEDGIRTVSRAIRIDYMNKWHAENIYQIGNIYAADPVWSHKVNYFLTEIAKVKKEYTQSSPALTITL